LPGGGNLPGFPEGGRVRADEIGGQGGPWPPADYGLSTAVAGLDLAARNISEASGGVILWR
jgi:hypothetical protein